MAKNPFPGTSFDTRRGKWKAQGRRENKTVHLGYFETQQEAFDVVTKVQAEIQEQSAQLAINGTSLASYRNSPTKNRRLGTVAQSNVLIERPWSMTMLEARIFVLMLHRLQTGGPSNQLITVGIPDLLGPGNAGGSSYQFLHAALDNLGSIRIDLPKSDKKNDYHKAPLMGLLKLDSGKGTISGYFSPEVMPFITNLLDSFTIGQVADLLSIKNPNSYKLYWIMQMWKFRSPYTVSVEELREMTTGLGTYPQFSDYRNRVLKPSLAELNQLNFDISFTEIRVGRVVDAVEFNIKYKEPKQAQQLQLQLTESTGAQPELEGLPARVAIRLRKLKLTEAQIAQVLTLSEDELTHLMKDTHSLLTEYESRSKVYENIAATAMSRINSLYPRLYPKHK